MAIISSHVLDSVTGDHAAGIRIECQRRQSNGAMEIIFSVHADEEGRISERVDLSADDEVQLLIHSQEYFDRTGLINSTVQIMPTIVVQLTLPDPAAKYHVPVMLSPHAYSIWWSGKTEKGNSA